MHNPNEQWQAKVNGETYDASFEELTEWIVENALLKTDQVRRGKLRWLEAGKVPPLREFFNVKNLGIEPPQLHMNTVEAEITVDATAAEETQVDSTHNLSENSFVEKTTDAQSSVNFEGGNEIPFGESDTPNQDICSLHPELPSKYVCETCFHAFCKSCPQSFGSKVKVCPYCGAMCEEIKQFYSQQESELQYQSDISGGFGFDDFGKALAYPFKYKSSLFFGGLLLGIFSFGQNAAKTGGFFLIVAGLICFMFANAVTFGVLTNTVDNFSKGFTDRDFFPKFEDFSLWDDVVHPFFLSLAVWISSFGLLILLTIGMVWYAWSSIAGQIVNTPESAVATLEKQSDQSKEHINAVKEKYRKQNAGRTDIAVGQDGLTEGQRGSVDEEAKFQSLNDLANNYRKHQLESSIGQTPEAQQKQRQAVGFQLIKAAGAFLIFGGIAFLWGLFYFPAACAVAGYTRSFVATINPLVGLDTIKHMGLDYFKLLVMTLLMWIVSAVIGIVLALIFVPFNLPRMGNLPAQFIGSFFTFYFFVVFAVTLGYALYKNSAKLKLHRG